MPDGDPFAERHGWKLYRASAFQETFGSLEAEVTRLAAERPDTFAAHPKAKLLARIRSLIVDEIPLDPSANVYGLGNTLGAAHRHWGARSSFSGSASSSGSTARVGSSSMHGSTTRTHCERQDREVIPTRLSPASSMTEIPRMIGTNS